MHKVIKLTSIFFSIILFTNVYPAGAIGPGSGNPYVPVVQTGQGVYTDSLTILESEQTIARISTGVAETALTVTNLVTAEVVFNQTVAASEQVNGPRAWVDAGWARGVTLPVLGKGLYEVAVASSVVSPSDITFVTETYRRPLFVTSTNPTADFLVVSPSLIAACYNTWPNYPRFTNASQPGKSCYLNPDAAAKSTRVGLKRPGWNKTMTTQAKYLIDSIEAKGYTWDIIDDTFLQDNPDYLNNYKAVIVVDQAEYATNEIRGSYDSYVAQGGRLLLLSMEVWIWNMRKEGDAYRVFKLATDPYITDQDSSNDSQIGDYAILGNLWTAGQPGPNDPTTRSTGSTIWLGFNPLTGVTGWTAYRTGHWLYANTSLADGDTFLDGRIAVTQFVDGVKTRFVGAPSLPYIGTDAATFSIPSNLLILATLETSNAVPWDCLTWTPSSVPCREAGTGVISIFESGANNGVVMKIPIKKWMIELQTDTQISQMLDNILDRFQLATGSINPTDGYSVTP